MYEEGRGYADTAEKLMAMVHGAKMNALGDNANTKNLIKMANALITQIESYLRQVRKFYADHEISLVKPI